MKIKFYPHVGTQSLQSCLALCDPMDYRSPGSSVHGILQARVLEWGAIAFSAPNLWNTVKAVLRGKFTAIQTYLKKQENRQINNLTLHLKQLEKEEMRNPRGSRRKEIFFLNFFYFLLFFF